MTSTTEMQQKTMSHEKSKPLHDGQFKTSQTQACKWCQGKGRIAPAFDCGPCRGTGGKTYSHYEGNVAREVRD